MPDSEMRGRGRQYLRFIAVAPLFAAFLALRVWLGRHGINPPPFLLSYPAIVLVALLLGFWAGVAAGRYRLSRQCKLTGAVLQNSNARLNLALDVAQLAEWERDLKTNAVVRSLRHAQIFGYTQIDSGWTYERFLSHLLPQYRAAVDACNQPALAGKPFDYEAQIRRVDGQVRWIWVRGRPRFDAAGRPVAAYGIIMDITERHQTHEALLRSEKLASVGRLAATIAHEINNPLEAVVNSLYLAKTAAGVPDTTLRYIELADAELSRIAHITRQSLSFYRETNAPALTQINCVLESVIGLMKCKIQATHAVINTRWRGDVAITAVSGELRQVFSNLLANSLDAIDPGGLIQLRVSAFHAPATGLPSVRITIADNGKGIAPASMPRLFEPFFTTKGAIGTGLGLWVSRQIIDKHLGGIRVRSSQSGPHRGTVFSITLPPNPTSSAPPNPSPKPKPPPLKQQKRQPPKRLPFCC